jgi:hypothetical protein
MDNVALALIVGGAAFVCSGLVFLLPGRRRRLRREETIDVSRARVDAHLQELRRLRGDLS